VKGFDYIINALEVIWENLSGMGGWLTGLCFGTAAGSVWLIDKIRDLITNTLTLLAAVTVPAQALPDIVGFCSLANYVLPLTEVCGMLFLLSVLYVNATAYRFAKSWIPTVS